METYLQLVSRPSVAILTALGLIWVLYLFGLAAYRLYFSPLSKFPGPKLAALTKFYELYYDVVRQGQFTFQIQKMHKKYGTTAALVQFVPGSLHPRSNRPCNSV